MSKSLLANPLIPEAGMSDPHAIVVGDVCYLFTGHDIGFGVEDWVMPDWRIYRSNNLQSWTHVGTISPADNFMGAGSQNCWAGDVVYRNGRFYWFFSNGKKGTGVMVADHVEGPYRDAIGAPLVESFDPTVFIEDDGTPYLIFGEFDYQIVELDDSLTALKGNPKFIEIDRKGIFPNTDKCSLHKHQGTYYLGCSGYYATSNRLEGPYEYKGCVGSGWGLDTGFGHGDFFVWRGDWYHVWCKYRNRTRDRIRDCFIAPVHFTTDGTMHNDLTVLEGISAPK